MPFPFLLSNLTGCDELVEQSPASGGDLQSQCFLYHENLGKFPVVERSQVIGEVVQGPISATHGIYEILMDAGGQILYKKRYMIAFLREEMLG